VYKNPKKTIVRGASAMQPSTSGCAEGVRRVRADLQETPLNIDGWWRRREDAVPADQVRCLPQDENALTFTDPTTGIFSAVFRTEAYKGASKSIKS
jgi:hypothetical protein